MPNQEKFCPDTFLGVDGNGVYSFEGVICSTGERTTATDTRNHTLGTCPNCSDPIFLIPGMSPTRGAGGTKTP